MTTKSALLALAISIFAATGPASASLVDCTCVANLPALQTNACQGIVPNLCLLATNCFSINVVIGSPGYCNQSPAPGTIVGPGTTPILFTVMDPQSNSAQCMVSFTVNPPPSSLSLTCAPNKTIQCGNLWNFDPPTPTTTCCNPSVNIIVLSTVTNGTCPQIITQTWKATDSCGNNAACSQTVTLVDTNPPVALCSTFNLVMNGDFELYTNCPSLGGQFGFTVPWFNPTAATPDYYNSCSPVGTGFSTPTNLTGIQIPHSGQGYAGAFVYTTSGTSPTNSYREYVEAPLLSPLIAGKSYRVSFYVSLAEQCSHAIAEIGAHVSVNPIISNGISAVLSVVPQVVNPSTNLLTSTNSWMLVQGTFTAAGGEKYLTLGNFRSDPATTAVPAAGTLFTGYSYYYYDDVSVIELCGPEATNKTVLCGSYWTFDQPIGYDDCSGYNVTVSVTSTVTNSICPFNATRSWLLADLCGNTSTWSQTVHILDTNPPVALCAAGANLVPNPSFENYSYCPYFFSQVNSAFPWFNPTIATPDYLNTCSGFGPVSVPTNYFGSQTPLTGQGYCGAFAYSQLGNNPPPGYREYLEVPLLAPLNPGQTYLVSFHVSLSDFSAFAIAEIGAHFSVGPVTQNDQAVMALTPQVVNPSTNLLTVTNGWMLVQGTFTAVGGEDHLTLGNFLSDALTTAVPAATGVPDYMTNFSYYYYDDVSVRALCSAQATNKTVVCGTTWTFDPPVAFDNCSGTNVSVTVLGTVTNGTCPILITRTWLLADMCGNTNTWSQTVTLLDNTPPFVDCVCASNAVASLLNTNACSAFVPDLSSLTNFGCFAGNCGPVQFSQSPPAGTPAGLGVHPVTVSAFSCGGASNGCVLPFTVLQPPSSLSLICATNKTVSCGSLWIFDPPIPVTTCCNPACSIAALSTTSNGTCAQVLTRVWMVTDACSNTSTCTQTVTVVDTTPPATMCSGINLVPNGDFEFYTNCPNADSQFDYAYPWFTPTAATSDYFNSCGGLNSPVSTPTNVVGIRTPLSGQAYAGAFVYGTNFGNSYREYLEVALTSPLVAGQQYRVSFNVSRSSFYGYAVAEIGARLSTGPIVSNLYTGVLNVVPQVVNPSANVIVSTANWTLIQGIFTASGGENYLTLGNFRPDPLTTVTLIGGFDSTHSYYYFDDVAVVPICPSQVTNKAVACNAPITFDTPVGFDNCSGTNVTVTIASTVTNGICPRVVTRTWNLTDQCGNTGTWSQSVTLTNNAPITINCACLQDSILPLLTTNGCSGVIPNLSLLTNSTCISAAGTNCGPAQPLQFSQSPPAGTVVGPGIHNVTVSFSRCSGGSNGCVLPYYVYSLAPIVVCPGNMYLLTCTGGAVGYFNPIVFNNVGPVTCSPPSGSVFPVGATTVTCTATNACGVSASCTFTVYVRYWYTRWGCITIVIALPGSGFGSGVVYGRAALPNGGGNGVDVGNLGTTGQDGMRLTLGPADKLSFTTLLDFNAPTGAVMSLNLPDVNGGPSTPLLTLTRSCQPHCGWNIKASSQLVNDTGATYRSIAIGTNGDLFSSFTHTAASLDTNVLVSLAPMGGATSAVMNVTFDCKTREISLAFPGCSWTPDSGRKGWDGCIYGVWPRESGTNSGARIILTPLTSTTLAPIASLDLLGGNLTDFAFDNPSLTAFGRKYTGEPSTTLMRAYDDGVSRGLEFAAVADGGGITMDLGHAASFRVRIGHFQNGDTPTEEQLYSIRGWPIALTNRPAPPPIQLRLAGQSTSVGCSADFGTFGVSNVTLQLWNGTTLVAEKAHVAASLGAPLASLSTFPSIIGCPGLGVLSLADTNPFTVYSGFDTCPGGCVGNELRILPEFGTLQTPPTIFTELQCHISSGLDLLLYDVQRTLACVPGPINVSRSSTGITLDWTGDTFRLQGAETIIGPWYDLGVASPVNLSSNSNLRFFRLVCD